MIYKLQIKYSTPGTWQEVTSDANLAEVLKRFNHLAKSKHNSVRVVTESGKVLAETKR